MTAKLMMSRVKNARFVELVHTKHGQVELTPAGRWLLRTLARRQRLQCRRSLTSRSFKAARKAARGVAGRIYPWGDGSAPTYARYRDNHKGRPLPRSVNTHPLDVSPYGVRGLGGNVVDWCVDRWTRDGALQADKVVRSYEEKREPSGRGSRVVRGGTYAADLGFACTAGRYDDIPTYRPMFL